MPPDESYHVCHRGYLSLFPFLLELLPSSSPHLGSILTLLRDPDHLWSPYGIRSLSASHPEFGQGEDYWKGPIWVQMNYLTLKALYKVCLDLLKSAVGADSDDCRIDIHEGGRTLPTTGPGDLR